MELYITVKFLLVLQEESGIYPIGIVYMPSIKKLMSVISVDDVISLF